MNFVRVAAVCIVTAVLVASCGSSEDTADLEDRISKLEDENAELRAQLQEAESDDAMESAPDEPEPTIAEEPSENTQPAPEVTEATMAEDPPPETTEPESENADADLAIEFGFTPNADRGVVSAGAIVTNSGAVSACGVEVQFTLLDSAGTPVDTTTESVAFVPAGASVNVAPTQIGYEVADPAELTVTVVKVEDTTSGASLDDCDGFYFWEGINVDVVNPALVPGDFGSSITGQLSNATESLVETSYINCVILAGGQIVGGESTASLDPISPGGTIAFDMSFITYEGNADEVRCTAVA